jgi:RimJ/RimL family protein N-acetyltransferase
MSDSWKYLLKDPNPWQPPKPLPAPIQTDRLVVRLYEQGDGPELFRAIDEDRNNLMPWMVWARTDHQTVDDSIHLVETFRRRAQRDDCTDYVMGMFSRETGRVVGGTGLHRIDAGNRSAEVGYWVTSDSRGKGLCTEAASALMSSAMTSQEEHGWGFRRIEVYNSADNAASRKICKKLGLRFEVRWKLAGYLGPAGKDGAPGYHDVTGYGVLAEEWDFENHRAKPNIGWNSFEE